MVLHVHRFDGSKGRCFVDYTTANMPGANAATAGKDYVATEGTLTFEAGEVEKTIHVKIIDDDLFEVRKR